MIAFIINLLVLIFWIVVTYNAFSEYNSDDGMTQQTAKLMLWGMTMFCFLQFLITIKAAISVQKE